MRCEETYSVYKITMKWFAALGHLHSNRRGQTELSVIRIKDISSIIHNCLCKVLSHSLSCIFRAH